MNKILETVRKEGAFAGFLSGSGPSVVCLTLRERADSLGEHMVNILSHHGIQSKYKVLSTDSEGARVL